MGVFVYDGREHPDPDPTLSVDQVKETMSGFFPEVATAETRTTQRGGGSGHRVRAQGRHQGVG